MAPPTGRAIAAEHRVKQLAVTAASMAYHEAKGGPGEFDALCAWSQANKIDAYGANFARLMELQAEVRGRRGS